MTSDFRRHARHLGSCLCVVSAPAILAAAPIKFEIPAQPAPAALKAGRAQNGVRFRRAAAIIG